MVTGEFAGLGLRKSSSYTLREPSVAPEVKDGLCTKTGEDIGKEGWSPVSLVGKGKPLKVLERERRNVIRAGVETRYFTGTFSGLGVICERTSEKGPGH